MENLWESLVKRLFKRDCFPILYIVISDELLICIISKTCFFLNKLARIKCREDVKCKNCLLISSSTGSLRRSPLPTPSSPRTTRMWAATPSSAAGARSPGTPTTYRTPLRYYRYDAPGTVVVVLY